MRGAMVEDNLVKRGEATALAEEADARVVEKLSKGDAERAAQRERRKEREKEEANPRENVDLFNQSQQEEAGSIRSALAELEGQPPSTKDEIHAAKGTFENLRLRVLEMEKKAASASYFLSAYDVRATSDLAKDLKAKIDGVQREVLPRKAFTFRRRRVMRERNAADGAQAARTKAKSSVQEGGAGAAGENASAQVAVEARGMKVEAREGGVVVIAQEDATSDDIEITGCKDCVIYVLAKMAVLRLVDLTSCRVFCGPVGGSLYLEGCRNSVVMAAAHQARIHHAHRVDFYLRTRSYPIIEKCSEVRFAPYAFSFEGRDAALEREKLSEENDLWSDVKDFGWLKSTQSPNWTVLPQDQRVEEVREG